MISEGDYLSLKVGDVVRISEERSPTWRNLSCPYATVEDRYAEGDRFQPMLRLHVFHERLPETLTTRAWVRQYNIESIIKRANERESE